jgi:beta-lysine 5,6-aminomutase alpha subunit
VLAEAVDLLAAIGSRGLLTAIAEGTFGVTKRPADGGRGLDGVVRRAQAYFNPAAEMLEPAGGSGGLSGSSPRASTAGAIR